MLGCFVVATSFVWTFHWSSLVATACPVHKMICRAQHFIFCVLILVWFWFLIFCEFWKNCSDFFWFLNFDFCFSLELDSWSLIFYWFWALKFSKLFILILVPKKSSMSFWMRFKHNTHILESLHTATSSDILNVRFFRPFLLALKKRTFNLSESTLLFCPFLLVL